MAAGLDNRPLCIRRAKLAEYKVLGRLQVVAEIPRNALGKIDRKTLLAMMSAGIGARRKLEVDPSGLRKSGIECGFALPVNHSKNGKSVTASITVVIVFFAPEIMP
jgi:hypothetical protein